jgi:non-ribosomal peptide synthetase-like protein
MRLTPPPGLRVRNEGRLLTGAGDENSLSLGEGERLEDLFEARCDEVSHELAVDGPGARLTYAELDARANRLAHLLIRRGAVAPGDRVGLLLEQPAEAYVAMLAVLKAHAAYVPLDAAFPADRLAYIASDANVRVILSESALTDIVDPLDQVPTLYVDELAEEVAAMPGHRPHPDGGGELCYVIYTSGTTGRPKGVAIRHQSICNFVRVAAEVYGVRGEDRMYQGLTIAFDFAIEEIWVAWMAGAALVPKPGAANLIGWELEEFLRRHRVSALCCVPTLLATLEDDLPDLSFLLVSGETCPQDLVERWSRPGRRFLNVYGPTETTVSATWTVLEAGRQVTIGVPLPTYSVVILEPNEDRALPPGEEGEIGIAGVGLADGYLNDPKRTAEAFIPDFIGIPANPSGRIYRSGDLGRVNAEGEIEHLGRIDTQVKVRGYRVDLAEIEAVLREVTGAGQAVVTNRQTDAGDELVAYYRPAIASAVLDVEHIYARLREKVPPYMVPAYLQRVDEVPLMPNGKMDRAKLPDPEVPRQGRSVDDYPAPASEAEQALAENLARVLGLERVSVDSHFFEDLGASSLLIAHFIAGLRRADPELPRVSIRQIYRHPTVRQLASAITDPDGREATPGVPPFEAPTQPEPIGTPRYVLCGILQALFFVGCAGAIALAFDAGSSWLLAGHGALSIYTRAVAVGAAFVVGIGAFPILAKWLLIGRFEPKRIRVWSLPYVRFWIVKTLVVANPAARLLRGTVLYRYYLLALGTRIGPGTLILTEHVPVCSDLISVGAGSVIRNHSFLNGYRARDGVIEIGPVSIGADAFVGELSTLDVYSTVQDGATVGHVSSVQAGQVVLAGETWHGSPVRPAPRDYEYRTVPSLPLARGRRFGFNAAILTFAMLVMAPLEVAVVSLIVTHPGFMERLSPIDALAIAAALMLGVIVLGLLVVGVVPRVLSRLLEPGRVYPLFGFHHELLRIILRVSNVPFFTRLFGDSVAIVGYLRYLGWRFGEVEQTGSNFGIDVHQEIPSLSRMGRGTMASDGLAMLNAEFSSTAFRVMPVEIGERCFLGNRLAWPAGARTGDNLLVGTMTMIPVGGEVRENTGLLGSPCFAIPRSVDGDEQFAALQREPERSRGLRAKTRHNVGTMALFLLSRYAFELIVLIIAFAPLGGWFGTVGTELLEVMLVPILVLGAAEIAAGARRLEPRFCSILDRQFWRHERFWKLQSDRWLHVFDGTPFKSLAWRALGVRVGARLFDDGAGIVEQSLTTIGDDVTLNMGCELQAHSLENGVFKSDHIAIEDRCTVGVAALVNYGTTMERGSVLEADSFLMKGSRVAGGSRWRGNPATEV